MLHRFYFTRNTEYRSQSETAKVKFKKKKNLHVLMKKPHSEGLDLIQKDLSIHPGFCVPRPIVSEPTFFFLKRTFFPPSHFLPSFRRSEEHAFSASSEFRGDFRWAARPHSLITRSETPAELRAALRGIKPPSCSPLPPASHARTQLIHSAGSLGPSR